MPMSTPPSSLDEKTTKMHIIYLGNELPGDDLQDLFRKLHNHSKDRNHPTLARFLEEAMLAVRNEIRQLPTDLKAEFPTFETIFNLVDQPRLRNTAISGSVEGVILCVFQIATWIGYLESRHGKATQVTSDTYLAGLGIGLLATAAISSAHTLTDLPKMGAQVVRIAFRLGLVVSESSQDLEAVHQGGVPLESWAYVVHGVTAQDVQVELDAVHARENIPETSKIFISAPGHTSVTISGPPSRLKALFRISSYFRDRKCIALPVYSGLCHAKHIYGNQHVERVIDIDALRSGDIDHLQIPVFSASTGRTYPARNSRELFKQIVSEILTQQIKWDDVVHGIIQHMKSKAISELHVSFLRNSLPIHDLMNTAKSSLTDTNTYTDDLLSWISDQEIVGTNPRGTMQSKIAIVGMSCRLPGGATDTEKFWNILEKGLDVHKKIPADRFDVDSHHDPTGSKVNTSHTAYGCFIDEPGLFDAPFFHMSPKEAAQTDPMQRLSLVTAYEALEKAGYVANRTAATNLHRIGTWYGQASDDYREVNTSQEISTYFIPGGCRAFGPGRINYFFKFAGPSFNCDTACSSSLAAIQAGCSALWNGDVDTVVAGGMNVLTNSDAFAGLSHGHFLTKTPNACKTWDGNADGYCRADGVGSVVMKRLEDAEADNDNILGVILAAATNHSANAVSITHPHAGHQADLTRQVMSRAGVDPLDVSFVEMHGTGTQAGDTEEIQSVADVFAPALRRRNADQPLHIGAVKSNVGHGEAAAGITALLKVLLMLQKEAIPRHVGIKNSINPAFPKDLKSRGIRIPYEKQPWMRKAGKSRIAVVNNFSAAGGNTTLAIQEAPARPTAQSDTRPSHVVSVSAKSKASLKGNLERILTYVETNPDLSLADLSYSTTARRHQHNYRIAIAAAEVGDLTKQLKIAHANLDSHVPIPSTGSPSIGFVFTGQGSSDRSMDLELFRDCPYFRAQILNLDSLAQGQGFPTIIPAIDGSKDKAYQHSPVVTQLALLCIEIALTRYWSSLGIKPDFVMGHSLGEYAAMQAASVLTASDAILLVGSRARILERKCQSGSHKMLAVRASLAEIEASVHGRPYEVACINGPKETVLCGSLEQMDSVTQPLQVAGYRCISLDVAFAFHSAQTDPILDEFEQLAERSVLFQPPQLPVISPLLEKVVFDDKTLNANYVRRATREPVNILSALDKARKMFTVDEKTVWIEIGPHPVCIAFVKSSLQITNVAIPSLRRAENNWTTITQSLAALHCAGLEISWNEFHRPFEKGLRLLDLPSYAWNDKTYWIQYKGDWALTKGNTFYNQSQARQKLLSPFTSSSIETSTVQQVIEERIHGKEGTITMQSDLMHADFLVAAHGHKMNGCGVVTSSIHADIAYTLGDYIYRKLVPGNKNFSMDVCDLSVSKGLVAQVDTQTPQLIQVTMTITDIDTNRADLNWFNVDSTGTVSEPFATAQLVFGDSSLWLSSWKPLAHLIGSRMQALDQMAINGVANRFSRKMAYKLFASNLVDYADKYRGMQSVVMHDYEAYAEVTLTKEKSGTWTVPPYFIDSVAHLAGFIMNCSDASDTKNSFCVTPGWQSMRFARPLTAGSKYQSYVKMIPTVDDPNTYLGDVYVMQDATIMGMVGGITFRRYPRVLLSRFFSPPDSTVAKSFTGTILPETKSASVAAEPSGTGHVMERTEDKSTRSAKTAATAPPQSSLPKHAVAESNNSTAAKAILLVAKETGLEVTDLTDDANFADLGIDSLMSLVISEKFRIELGVTVGGSLFLEYPTIGDMRSWLAEYYS